MAVLPAQSATFDFDCSIAIVGAGASGLVAALAASDAGADVIVLERDSTPSGSTSLSSGMIPACCTLIQSSRGIADSVNVMSADILRKARNQTEKRLVVSACRESGPAIDWLTRRHGVQLSLVDGFLYPGHSCLRMHAPESRSGADLEEDLLSATHRVGVEIVKGALVTDLFARTDGCITGLRIERTDGCKETLGCKALILACNGFGGNSDMVADLIPEMKEAIYFGHRGNQGDAVRWGEALGAKTADMGSYQGHGSVAHPHGVLISWALMMNGGIQINRDGRRFSNEHDGYSEQAQRVLEQPGAIAWNIYDEYLESLVANFEDYRHALECGAIRKANEIEHLAQQTGIDPQALVRTIREVVSYCEGLAKDPLGRTFQDAHLLEPPYCAVRVTGALFHTQGGLVIDEQAHVLGSNDLPLPNLFAGGGAARGFSGPGNWGYLSGNGLLSAVAFGRIAGRSAAKLASGKSPE